MIPRKPLAVVLALFALTRPAFARDSDKNSQNTVPASRRAVSVGAAAVPGAVVHGAGHYALGKPKTARKLLLAEGIGLGMILASGVTLAASGASRYVVGPTAATGALGFGLFSMSWFADIYGTAASETGASLSRHRAPARIETEFGYRYVYDPQFAYRHFATQKLSVWASAFRLAPAAYFSLDADNARYEFDITRRISGALPGEKSLNANFVDMTFGFMHHRYRPEHFTLSGIELSVDGRYDLGALGETLRGAFFDFGGGIALQRIDYDVRGSEIDPDYEDLLLAQFGFGVLLRGLLKPGSEAMLYYDHRHDDFAAGLKVTGLGSGPVGHFGARTRLYFADQWGIVLDAQAGSAYLAGASLVVREGVQP